MSGLLFLALLMVMVSGLIAYIGDLIGRKMGRKRLTLFGLRPRHTAIVISVIAGMLIAIFTFAAAFIVSKPVRLAIFVPREILQKANDNLNEANENLIKENDTLNSRLVDERRNLGIATEKRADAEKQMQDGLQKLAGVGKELATRQKLIDEKKRQLAKVENDLQQSRKELLRTGQKLTSVGRKLADLQREYDNLTAELNELKTQITALDPFVRANFSLLAFASGQEILSGLIPAKGSTRNARRENLHSFLNTAESIVHQQCELKSGDNALVFLRVENGNITRLTENEAVELLADRLVGVSDARDAIIRFAPANNVPVGGQAFIIVNDADVANPVQVIPNTRVYNAGDEVAKLELTITPQLSNGEILTSLVDDLLREKVPNALREKKVMLILRRFVPGSLATLPGTSSSLVSWSDLATVMEQARKLNGKVSIIARSNKTMNRFDPLSLSLEVKGSGE